MNVKICKFCRKSFQGFSNLCPACVEQLDQKYITVRNYLDRNPDSNMHDIAGNTGVDEKSLLYLMREGRLALRGEPESGIRCLKCGQAIVSGKYCGRCRDDLVRSLENTRNAMGASVRPEKPKAAPADEKSRMHILKDD